MRMLLLRFMAALVLSGVATVCAAPGARAADPAVAGGLSFGSEQTLRGGADPDLTLDGFVEVTFASGVYGGLAATADAFAGDADEEADLYLGFSRENARGLTVGLAYGLHFEDDAVDCCGAVEASLGFRDATGRALDAMFGVDLDGACCVAGLTVTLPAGRGTVATSDLSYDDDDDAPSASLSVSRGLSAGLTLLAAAGRDGSDQSDFAEIGLAYEFGGMSALDLTLRDTSIDPPSLSLIYSVSFDTAR